MAFVFSPLICCLLNIYLFEKCTFNISVQKFTINLNVVAATESFQFSVFWMWLTAHGCG